MSPLRRFNTECPTTTNISPRWGFEYKMFFFLLPTCRPDGALIHNNIFFLLLLTSRPTGAHYI